MKPWMLAALGVLVVAVSGVLAMGLFADASEPEGTIASDNISITVGQASSGFAPSSGAEWGLAGGVGLLLVALVWQLVSVQRSRRSHHKVNG